MLDSLYTRNRFQPKDYYLIQSKLENEYKRTSDGELKVFIQLFADFNRLDDKAIRDKLLKDVESEYENYPNAKARIYSALAFDYFLSDQNFDKAFDMIVKLENLLELYGYNKITAYSFYYGQAAGMYYKFRDYHKAIESYTKYVQNPFFKLNKCFELNNIGVCYVSLKRYDSATHYFQLALTEAKSERTNDPENIALSLISGNIGNVYYLQKKYSEAKPLINFDLQNALRIKDFALAAGAAIPLADIYLAEKKIGVADSLLTKARLWINTSNEVNRLEKLFPVRSTYYEMIGDYKLANNYKDSTVAAIYYNDSVFNSLIVKRSQQRMDTEKLVKEQTKFIVYKEINQTRIIAAALVLILLGSVLFVIAKYRNKAKRDKQKIAELNNIIDLRQRISADMHDEIGSIISSISMYAHALLLQPQTPDQKNIAEKIKENSQAVQENISEIIWNLNPDKDSFEELTTKMRSFGAELTELLNIHFSFVVNAGLSVNALNAADRKNIYLIYKEAINNAVKYSACRNLSVMINIDEQQNFIMAITDDGKGFDMLEKSAGNGLVNMKRRAIESNGQLHIESKVGNGTAINFKMKIKGTK